MLYDVPGRTGITIALETYEAAARATTTSSRSRTPSATCAARRPAHARLGYAVYSGDDVANLGWLAHGGVRPRLGRRPRRRRPATRDGRRLVRGDHAEALAHLHAAAPGVDAVMGVANYGATTAKAALELLGVLDNRHVRGPLVPLDDAEVAALRARACGRRPHLTTDKDPTA